VTRSGDGISGSGIGPREQSIIGDFSCSYRSKNHSESSRNVNIKQGVNPDISSSLF